jgi:hypothetical protein
LYTSSGFPMVTFLAGDGEAGGIDQPFVLYPIVRVPRGSLSVLQGGREGARA